MLIGRTLFLLLLFINFQARAQDFIDHSATKSIEGYFFPALGFNHVSIGFGVLNGRGVETSVVAACNVHFFGPATINLNITGNRNHYIKNKSAYIPVWARISNSRRNIGYEEGYFPHTLRFSIGSGIGDVVKISKRFFMRAEIGLGISLNLTNPRGYVWPFKFDYANYSVDNRYPKYNPPILPAFRFRISFMKPLPKRKKS